MVRDMERARKKKRSRENGMKRVERVPLCQSIVDNVPKLCVCVWHVPSKYA